MNIVKNKYRSTPNEHLHQCLRLAVTPFMPKFKPQKSVTFHTNKARPHHLLCIVRKFLLELCFWILTVTVPDPGLNGNLASGPFGFLFECPCSSGYVCVCVCVCVYICLVSYVHMRVGVCTPLYSVLQHQCVCVCVCVCVCEIERAAWR